jgi:hypothetical protein
MASKLTGVCSFVFYAVDDKATRCRGSREDPKGNQEIIAQRAEREGGILLEDMMVGSKRDF